MSSVLEISPLTRVEGHGRITVSFSGSRVEKVDLSLFESPRFFEALLTGKSYREVPEIICRVCSLCSTVHRICALQAVEEALQVQVSEQTALYRELILCGGHIQSHALHLFCLVLPDVHGVAGLAGLAGTAPETLKSGLRIKGVGNLIQETVGGRLIHPVTLIPGGMGKPVHRDGLRKMQEALRSILPDLQEVCTLFASVLSWDPPLATPRYLSVRPEAGSPFYGNSLRLGHGKETPAAAYRDLLHETPSSHGNAKITLVDGEPAIVGAQARMNLGLPLTPLAAAAFSEHREMLAGAGIYGNSLAQAIELFLAAERSLEILEILLEIGFKREDTVDILPHSSRGSAAIEAPRGLLLHSYTFDSRGTCIRADIITPTAINQAAMERDLFHLASCMEGADDHAMATALEALVRAYDPCISCAVHLLRL